jgi:hypothetical protein
MMLSALRWRRSGQMSAEEASQPDRSPVQAPPLYSMRLSRPRKGTWSDLTRQLPRTRGGLVFQTRSESRSCSWPELITFQSPILTGDQSELENRRKLEGWIRLPMSPVTFSGGEVSFRFQCFRFFSSIVSSGILGHQQRLRTAIPRRRAEEASFRAFPLRCLLAARLFTAQWQDE